MWGEVFGLYGGIRVCKVSLAEVTNPKVFFRSSHPPIPPVSMECFTQGSSSGKAQIIADSHFHTPHPQECFTQGGSSGEVLIAALLALLAHLPARIEALR